MVVSCFKLSEMVSLSAQKSSYSAFWYQNYWNCISANLSNITTKPAKRQFSNKWIYVWSPTSPIVKPSILILKMRVETAYTESNTSSVALASHRPFKHGTWCACWLFTLEYAAAHSGLDDIFRVCDLLLKLMTARSCSDSGDAASGRRH